MIIEKSASYLNNDNFLSNNHILAKSFADSQSTKPIQLVLHKQCGKIAIYHNTSKTYFKTDYREYCNFFK